MQRTSPNSVLFTSYNLLNLPSAGRCGPTRTSAWSPRSPGRKASRPPWSAAHRRRPRDRGARRRHERAPCAGQPAGHDGLRSPAGDRRVPARRHRRLSPFGVVCGTRAPQPEMAGYKRAGPVRTEEFRKQGPCRFSRSATVRACITGRGAGVARRRHVLGYRCTPAGPRQLRLPVTRPAAVMVGSSPRQLRCDVAPGAHGSRFPGGRRPAALRARGSAGPPVAWIGVLSVSPARNRSYTISSSKRYWR